MTMTTIIGNDNDGNVAGVTHKRHKQCGAKVKEKEKGKYNLILKLKMHVYHQIIVIFTS